jgi:MerR family mercuric resistance operon transcriptional regulator
MDGEGFSIGRLARDVGVSVETIRYYERIGLMEKPARSGGDRRIYDDGAVRRLVFIRRARELGFSIEGIRTLLMLSGGKGACAEVYAFTEQHLADVRAKIADLQKLELTLTTVAGKCSRAAARPCAIIDALTGDTPAATGIDRAINLGGEREAGPVFLPNTG